MYITSSCYIHLFNLMKFIFLILSINLSIVSSYLVFILKVSKECSNGLDDRRFIETFSIWLKIKLRRLINVPLESINNCEWNIFPLKNILLGKYDKYFRLIWSKSILSCNEIFWKFNALLSKEIKKNKNLLNFLILTISKHVN